MKIFGEGCNVSLESPDVLLSYWFDLDLETKLVVIDWTDFVQTEKDLYHVFGNRLFFFFFMERKTSVNLFLQSWTLVFWVVSLLFFFSAVRCTAVIEAESETTHYIVLLLYYIYKSSKRDGSKENDMEKKDAKYILKEVIWELFDLYMHYTR